MEPRGNLVLVTGASGFIGSRVARRLVAEGARVRAIVRRQDAADELAREGIEPIVGELANPSDLHAAVQGAAAVVHVAATGTEDRTEASRINTQATALLAEAALAAGCERFVHISTLAVHDVEGLEVVDEESPLVASNSERASAYAATKADGDRAIFRAIELGLRAVILRPGAVLGAHPTSTWGSLTPRAIAAGQFPLVAGGQGTLPYVHVENFVDGILAALRLEAAVGQAFNIIDGQTTWGRFIDIFRKGSLPPAPDNPALSFFAFRGSFSNEKARRVLGYTPTRTFDEAIAETLAFIGA